MYAPPPKKLYYAVCQIQVSFVDVHTGNSKGPYSGSGFIVCHKGKYFVVSARHVFDLAFEKRNSNEALLFKNYRLGSVELMAWGLRRASRNGIALRGDERNETRRISFRLDGNRCAVFSDDCEDVGIIQINERDWLENSDNTEVWSPYFFNSEMLGVDADFKKTRPSEPISAIGFPKLSRSDVGLPLSRCGTISTDPVQAYHGPQETRARAVAIELYCSSGLSGAPVFVHEAIKQPLQIGQPSLNRDNDPTVRIDWLEGRRCYVLGVVSRHYDLVQSAADGRDHLMHAMLARCERADVISELLNKVAVFSAAKERANA
jgi:hypothetical protein